MAEKFNKTTFGKTFHPIRGIVIQGKMRAGETESQQYADHKKIKERFSKQGVRPSEIAKLDKEFDRRYKSAIKSERRNKKIQNSKILGTGYTKKQQSAKASDTGSEYRSGGRVNLRGGGMSQRGLGKAFKDGGRS